MIRLPGGRDSSCAWRRFAPARPLTGAFSGLLGGLKVGFRFIEGISNSEGYTEPLNLYDFPARERHIERRLGEALRHLLEGGGSGRAGGGLTGAPHGRQPRGGTGPG